MRMCLAEFNEAIWRSWDEGLSPAVGRNAPLLHPMSQIDVLINLVPENRGAEFLFSFYLEKFCLRILVKPQFIFKVTHDTCFTGES